MKKKSYNSPKIRFKDYLVLNVLSASGGSDNFLSEENYNDFW